MNETENEKTVKHIRETIGQEAYGFKVDVSDRTNVYKAARESEILAGKVTILVNNAGIVGGKDFLDLDDKVIEKVLEGNDRKFIKSLHLDEIETGNTASGTETNNTTHIAVRNLDWDGVKCLS